jgi:opacity protein-like surface antigen
MRKLVIGLIVAVCTLTPVLADSDGHVNFFLGFKQLDSDDWEPVDQQGEVGAVMSFGQDDWPVHIAADVLGSADEEETIDPFFGPVTFTGSTFEVDAGVRKIWKVGSGGKCMPYVGAGLGLIAAAAEIEGNVASVDADDSAVGFWGGAGVFWRLGSRFNIGLDVRYSTADVDLDFGGGLVAEDIAAGGFHYGMLLGFGW